MLIELSLENNSSPFFIEEAYNVNLASGSEALSRLLPHYPLLMKLFSRGRPRLSTVAKPRLGDRDQHAAKQATKQPRKLNRRVAWERRASTDEGRRLKTWRVEGWAPSRRGFVSFSPMDKFRQARTCCQVCRVTKGERLSFRGAASNERKPRNRRAVTSGGSMNAQESFVARTRRRFNAWKTISRTNRARTISASLFRFLPFFPLLLLGSLAGAAHHRCTSPARFFQLQRHASASPTEVTTLGK